MVVLAGGVAAVMVGAAAAAAAAAAASVVCGVAVAEWRPLALSLQVASAFSREEAPDEGARFVTFFATLPSFLDLCFPFSFLFFAPPFGSPAAAFFGSCGGGGCGGAAGASEELEDLAPARAFAAATIAATLFSSFSPGIAGDVDDPELLLPVCLGFPPPAGAAPAFRGGAEAEGDSLALRLGRCADESGLLAFALGGAAGEVSEPELDFRLAALFLETFRCFLPPSGELRRFPFAAASFNFCFCLAGGDDEDVDGFLLAAFVVGGTVALADCPLCRSLASVP